MKALLMTVLMFAFLGQCKPETTNYSTCPPVEEAVKLSDLYLPVDPPELLKYAKVRVQPQIPESCRCEGSVRVEVMVKGEHVFCATALDGHPLLQEAAVKAAMQWRFKKRRPESKSNIIGVLVFDFKS